MAAGLHDEKKAAKPKAKAAAKSAPPAEPRVARPIPFPPPAQPTLFPVSRQAALWDLAQVAEKPETPYVAGQESGDLDPEPEDGEPGAQDP